jgi:hypothetical protein
VNSSQAFSHSLTTAGYLAPHASQNWKEPFLGGPDRGRGIDGSQLLGDLVPVFAGGVLETVPQQVDHTGLDLSVLPEAC